MRGGWLSTSVRLGDKITVNGFAAKNGSRFAYARAVIASDGRTLFARSSFETAPPK